MYQDNPHMFGDKANWYHKNLKRKKDKEEEWEGGKEHCHVLRTVSTRAH